MCFALNDAAEAVAQDNAEEILDLCLYDPGVGNDFSMR